MLKCESESNSFFLDFSDIKLRSVPKLLANQPRCSYAQFYKEVSTNIWVLNPEKKL